MRLREFVRLDGGTLWHIMKVKVAQPKTWCSMAISFHGETITGGHRINAVLLSHVPPAYIEVCPRCMDMEREPAPTRKAGDEK